MVYPSRNPVLNLFFLFILCATIITSSASIVNETCAKVTKIDPITTKYEFCVAALNSVPGSRDADLITLGQISIDLAARNATRVMPMIQRLLDDPKIDTSTKKYVLKDCLLEYSRVSDLVKQATAYYKAKKFYEASNMVGGIGGAATTCEDDFEFAKVPSLLPKQDADVFQLSVIALDIISLFIE